MTDRDHELDPGKAFDRRMAAYLAGLRHQAMSRRGLLRGAAGAATAAAMAGALGTASAAGPRPFAPGLSVLKQEAGTIIFGLDGSIRGLEPALAYDFQANPVVCQISEGLMMFTPEGAIEPLLAETYDHPDALTYVYTLRQGITFHDGSTMTIDDVIASIERVQDEEVAGPMAWMYDPVESVTKTDDRTLTIKLSAPSALYQFVAATTAGHVVPKAAIEEFGLDFSRNPVGTGPYKFVGGDLDSEVELEKNSSYWQEGLPFFDKVVFKVVPEGTTRITGLRSGDLQIIRDVPVDQIEVVKGFENVTFQEVVGYTIEYVVFRYDRPPFNDPNIRKAVAHAIDFDSIQTNLIKDYGVRAIGTVPPNMPGSAADQITAPAYDLEMAKQLMAESTMPDGFQTKIVVISPNDLWAAQVLAIQEALKAINIDVEIEQYPYADYITLLQDGNYEGMAHVQWGSDFPDASGNLLPMFHSRNHPPQNNTAYYSNPEVDRLLDAAEAEQDPEARTQMLIDVQKIVAEDQPHLWIDHNKWFMPMDSTLTGYTITPLWYWDSFMRTLRPA